MLAETNEADALHAALAQLCDAQRIAILAPREIEGAKQEVIRIIRNRFGQKSTQPRAYVKIGRPDSVDERDDEDELSQETACEQLKLLHAQRPDTQEWRLWLYLWARRVDEALVQRVPSVLSGGELDRIGAALMQTYRGLLLFDRRNSEYLLGGKRLSVALAQQAQQAQLIFVQLREENGTLSLLGITKAGLLYHFASRESAVQAERLYAIVRNLGLRAQETNLHHVAVADSVPFDPILLLYIVNEAARLTPRNQMTQLVRWLAYIDAPTLALFHSYLLRTHYLAHFLGEATEEEEAVEVMAIDDDSTQSQPEARASLLATSVTQLAALLESDEDVSDAVLLDVVQLVMRPRLPESQCIADPMNWHNQIVLLGRAIDMPAECELALVPINHRAHWSLLLLTQERAWYYSSLEGDTYGATVKKKLAASLPRLEFAVINGPLQGVDRECALFVLNMMQYALDGHALHPNIVITKARRVYTRRSVQSLLLQQLRESLVRDNVVTFCVDELTNFWRQDLITAQAFAALMTGVLVNWPALAKRVAKLAPGKAKTRDALTLDLAAQIAVIKQKPRVLVIEDSSSSSDEEEIIEEIVAEEEPVFPVVARDSGEHAQRYDIDDPVDALVAYVRELRDDTHAELSGKYSDATLWDADFLGDINRQLQRLGYSEKLQVLIRRSLDHLFYERDRRNQRVRLQNPSDEQIRSELERYRVYKK